MHDHAPIRNVNEIFEEKKSFGQAAAHAVTKVAGSWPFIVVQSTVLLAWIVVNAAAIAWRWDPCPFIHLNLVLSLQAAHTAPIIMMSQNRQEAKDRLRSEHDYKINLKAELEIQLLNKKIDHLLIHQNKRLLEIQRIQTEMMEVVLKRLQ